MTPSTTSTSEPTPTDPGRLVILDDAGDIVVINPDGTGREAITGDAGESAAYTQPIWAPDGDSLAWGQVTGAGFAVGFRGADGSPTTVPTANLPFYMSWSPEGDRLGVLHNGTTGVAFGLLDVMAADFRLVDEDAPFYFSWNPDGGDLVTHAGDDRVDLIDVEGESTSLEPTEASYLAPHWTEAGTFHVSDGSLVLETPAGRGEVATTGGLAMFVANEAGTLIAVQTAAGNGAIEVALADPPSVPNESVVVIDVVSGEAHRVTDELALGFFWSPDGRSLLVLTPSGDRVQPTVWSAGADRREFARYRPPPTLLQDTFPFFPQYAQSVRFWSPDSSAFAFAGDIDGETGIWIQDVDGDDPVLVSDGRWVAWSPERSPSTDG